MKKRDQIILRVIKSFIKKDDLAKVTLVLNRLHPADAAEIVETLPEEDRKKVFETWSPHHSADVFLEMDEQEQVEVAESLRPSLVSDILEEMPADDATDLLGDLPKEIAERILTSMEEKEAVEVRKLLEHGKETAGGLMTPEYIALKKDMTAQQAINLLRKKAPDAENIYYIFVVNKENQLVGVVSLRDLIIAQPKAFIKEIMDPEVIFAEAGTDQEEVAKIMSKYDLLALPVINRNHELLGIVTIDDVVDVIEDEATEDMYRLAGTRDLPKSDIMGNRLSAAVRARIPWLIIALVGEVFVVGFIANRFSYLIALLPALTIYWATMTSIGGNTSFQASTVAVRALATGELDPKTIWLRLFREVRLGIVLAIIPAAILFVTALLWQKMLPLAIIVALANLAIIVLGAFTGTLAPIILNRFGIDPAVSSSPFLALLMDAFSLFIYFAIAAVILRFTHLL